MKAITGAGNLSVSPTDEKLSIQEKAMTTLDMLVQRNQEFARHQFNARLSPMGRLKTMIVSCVDARVDPGFVLGLEAGDAMVIRTLGGRITPATLQTITLLLTAAQVLGANAGTFNLIVLHHTQYGITPLVQKPDLLASYFGVDEADVERIYTYPLSDSGRYQVLRRVLFTHSWR